jgi:type IV pilus assembly protein PilN
MRPGDAEVPAVILINLLPHREAARKRRRESFNLWMGIAVLMGGLFAGAIFLWYEGRISEQLEKVGILQGEVKKLDSQIKDIVGLRSEITALRARQQAVEDLQSDRNLPVHMLNELVKQLPDGVFLKSLRQDNQSVTLQGIAQSNELISELLHNLTNNTPWLSRPDLIEIVSDTVTLGAKDQRRVSKFTLRVRLVRSSETPKSAPAATGFGVAKIPASSAVAASAPTKP